MKIFAQNKKAYFDYNIDEKFEAGIVLNGNEVKSIRENQIVLSGSYILFSNGEIILINCKISKLPSPTPPIYPPHPYYYIYA